MNTELVITPTFHPEPKIRAAGFELSDPYVEQCWSAILGPSATLLLRRLPAMWADNVPARVDRDQLSRSLGLGAGVGDNSRLMRSLERCVSHRLARWYIPGHSLDVFLNVPALRDQQVARLPEWSQAAHRRLLTSHVEKVAPQLSRAPVSVRHDLCSQHTPSARRTPLAR